MSPTMMQARLQRMKWLRVGRRTRRRTTACRRTLPYHVIHSVLWRFRRAAKMEPMHRIIARKRLNAAMRKGWGRGMQA